MSNVNTNLPSHLCKSAFYNHILGIIKIIKNDRHARLYSTPDQLLLQHPSAGTNRYGRPAFRYTSLSTVLNQLT